MDIQITARHFHSSEGLTEKIEAKINKLTKFYENITAPFVVLDAKQEHSRQVEIKMNIVDKSISAKAEEENMGKALESAFSKIEKQLKKANELQHDYKSQPTSELVD